MSVNLIFGINGLNDIAGAGVVCCDSQHPWRIVR